MSENLKIKHLEIVTLTGERFPIKSRWSVEAEKDILGAHALDLEEEIMNFLFNEIKQEIKVIGWDNIKSIEFIKE